MEHRVYPNNLKKKYNRIAMGTRISISDVARPYSPLKGEEADSDDETPEVDITTSNVRALYEQWKENPQSLHVQAYVMTRNPFCPSLKLKQPVDLSVAASHVNLDDETLALHFFSFSGETVYYSYDQNKLYSTIKILLFEEVGKAQVIALEKIFIPTPKDPVYKFSSLNTRLKTEVAHLNAREIRELIRSALSELAIPPDDEVSYILSRNAIEIHKVHSLLSLSYLIR